MHADLRNPHYVAWRSFLEGAEAWDADRIGAYQLGELRRVVRWAVDRTEGYRRLLQRAGVAPEDVDSLDAVRRLPCVTKEDLQADADAFTASRRHATFVTTGGSTGIPFGFWRDRVAFSRELASKAHQYARVGWSEGQRQIVFRGVPIGRPSRIAHHPRFNELRCSSYHLTGDWMERFVDQAWAYRPRWLRCYPSSGQLVADWLLEHDRAFPPLAGVLCASENLYPAQLAHLRAAFPGARVFSHYGHYELAVLAGFCEAADTYHVLPFYGLAELIGPDGGPVTRVGEIGEIVATSFVMTATPFVRYRTRDFAVLGPSPCPSCGRPYPVWTRIEGRLQDFVLTGGGRLVSMTAINMHDDTFEGIRQFQFMQEQAGRVEFRYIPKAAFGGDALARVVANLQRKFGADVTIDPRQVEDIAASPRGKHRFLEQRLTLAVGDAGGDGGAAPSVAPVGVVAGPAR